jgi:hypothetical protein
MAGIFNEVLAAPLACLMSWPTAQNNADGVSFKPRMLASGPGQGTSIIPLRCLPATEARMTKQTGRSLMPKNDVVRKRGDYLGEAGADWSYGATAKPEADEHFQQQGKSGGLRGQDKQQGELRDQTSNMGEPERGDPAATHRSLRQDAQHGADVRGNPPMVQGSGAKDSLPEGLQRERKGPYDKNVGRNQDAAQVPKNWTGK